MALKKTILLSYLALLICFGAAYFVNTAAGADPVPTEGPAATPTVMTLRPAAAEPTSIPEAEPLAEPVYAPEPAAAPEPSPLPAVEAGMPAAPERIRVRHGEDVIEQNMQDYLLQVLAAEMPASFQPEALKAQAVAARTFAMYCAATGHHEDAQVCTDFACCQAWTDAESLKSLWGERYGEYMDKLRTAVEETEGEYLCYGGEPVFAAFHSSSCGQTEDCGAIWSALPYLVSVSSPEGADSVPDYISYAELTPLDFRDSVLHARPDADFTGEEEGWIGEIRRDGSGRVESALLGGAELSGAELRELFSLRSAAFTLEYSGGAFLFTVTGHGHGVGMSQYGANVMAAEGADYARILAHYYPGTLLAG